MSFSPPDCSGLNTRLNMKHGRCAVNSKCLSCRDVLALLMFPYGMTEAYKGKLGAPPFHLSYLSGVCGGGERTLPSTCQGSPAGDLQIRLTRDRLPREKTSSLPHVAHKHMGDTQCRLAQRVG